MKTFKYIFLFLFLFSTFSLIAQGFYYKSFDVSIELKTDGTFSVREDMDVFFTEEKRGIIRSIPTRVNVNNQEYSINIKNINVPNWKSKINKKRNGVNIRIGDPNVYISGDQNYIIEYEVEKAMIKAADHLEFYWNLTGNDNPRIEEASFEIRLPDEIDNLPFQYEAYSGLDGEVGKDVTIDHIGNIIAGNSTTTLEPGRGITVAVNLPLEVIDDESFVAPSFPLESNDRGSEGIPKSRDGGYPFIPAALLALIFGAYRKHGINQGRLTDEEIKEQFYPPEDMNPAEVGTFYDFTVHSRDLISLIPKWGNQGCVEVRSIPDHKGDSELYFYKLKQLPLDSPDYEVEFFNALFKDGDQVFIGDLKNKFYQDMSKAKSRVNKEIKGMELYDPYSMQYFKRWPNIVGFILCLVVGLCLMGIGKMYFTGGLLVLTGIALLVFLIRRPKLSDRGLALHNKLRGFYKFLKDPKPSKLNELIRYDEKYLEKVFPYVVAFGIDKTWNENIATKYPDYTPPPWYYYQSMDGRRMSATSWSDFGTNFNVKTINSVFSSAPQSTGGSSGSFSGGSSGGGFGGGGSSSW